MRSTAIEESASHARRTNSWLSRRAAATANPITSMPRTIDPNRFQSVANITEYDLGRSYHELTAASSLQVGEGSYNPPRLGHQSRAAERARRTPGVAGGAGARRSFGIPSEAGKLIPGMS